MAAVLLPVVTLLVVPACTPHDGGPGDADEVTVLAASSLTGVLDDVATDLEARVAYAGSADLVAQVVAGSPADVLVTADERTMQVVADEGLVVGGPTAVATNRLVVVTTPGAAARVTSPADLARRDLDVVVCAPQVPCGAATAAAFADLGVTLAPRSEEHAVTDVLGKVVAGEADAGVVWVTDAERAGDAVHVVELPDVPAARTRYLAAVVGPSPGARRFVEHLAGPEGRAALAEAGFGPP